MPECLNAAAVLAGFFNYNHARNHFERIEQDRPWVNVKCKIKWKTPAALFPELVGHLQVTVTPRKGLSKEDLQRLVFVIPEFWTPHGAGPYLDEHFRIDSAYYHRVTARGHVKLSERTNRNVLSFHLLNNRWMASIFDYGTKLLRTEMESQIQQEVSKHITSTVQLYQEGRLDKSRILSDETYLDMVSVGDPSELKRMLTPF